MTDAMAKKLGLRKTTLLPSGVFIDAKTQEILGWKCTACSTAHTHNDIKNPNELADAIIADMHSHSDCARLY